MADPTRAGWTVDDAAGEPTSDVPEETPHDPAPDLLISDAAVAAQADVPELPLTADQRRIQELENQLALERGRKDTEPELEEVTNPGDEANILIHFLEDGFSALGQVWYRGQELEFDPSGKAYKDTFDRRGRTWLSLRNDEFSQVERWGKVMFRSGPWPGKSYREAATATFETVRDSTGRAVPPPSAEEFTALERLEAKRRRAAPKLPTR